MAEQKSKLTHLQLPAGWVTPAQFKELISQRAEENHAFGRNVRALNMAHDNDWRKWPQHLQQDVFEKLGVTAVLMPIGVGGAVVSDCSDLVQEPVPNGIYFSPLADNFYDMDKKHGQGNEFYMRWFARREEFPRWDPPAISGGRAKAMKKGPTA